MCVINLLELYWIMFRGVNLVVVGCWH